MKLFSLALALTVTACGSAVGPACPAAGPGVPPEPETTYCDAVADLQSDLETCGSGSDVGDLCLDPSACAPADEEALCQAIEKLRGRRYMACGVATLACDGDDDCSSEAICLCGGCA